MIFFDKKILPKIFNYKNSLSTNQMGFDTIEINLVLLTPAHPQTLLLQEIKVLVVWNFVCGLP